MKRIGVGARGHEGDHRLLLLREASSFRGPANQERSVAPLVPFRRDLLRDGLRFVRLGWTRLLRILPAMQGRPQNPPCCPAGIEQVFCIDKMGLTW